MADPRDVVLDVSPEDIQNVGHLEESIKEWSVRLAMYDQQMATARANIRGLMEAKSSILSKAMKASGIVPGQVSHAEISPEGKLVLKVVDVPE